MMRMGMRRLTVTGKRVSAKLSKLDMKQALIQGLFFLGSNLSARGV